MTQEIIEMAQECGLVGMRPHLDGIYIESLLAFAKLVADKALAEHAMQEVQRLGQEIEQEPVKYSDYEPDGVHHNKPPQRTWVGLTNDELTDLFYNTNLGQQSAVAQAIALLKEKNGYVEEKNT